MASFYFEIEASGIYSVTAPTLEVLLDGFVVSSVQVETGPDRYAFLLDYSGSFPSSLALRFNDGSGEGGRSIVLDSVWINGWKVSPSYLGALSLLNGESSAVNTGATAHLYGRQEPVVSDIGTETQTGTAGDDRIAVPSTPPAPGEPDIINAGDGNDRVIGSNNINGNAIFGGIGADTLFGGTGNDIIVGAAGDDMIVGNAGDDILHGGDGNDTIQGGAGNDVINGGAGDDFLSGAAGDDIIFGEEGNDTILGGAGNDLLFGDNGDDVISGGAGNDEIYGGLGHDTLQGDGGDDVIYGEAGNDILIGGAGNDILYGNNGNDTLIGGIGNDLLHGGDGNDFLYAHSAGTVSTVLAPRTLLNANFATGNDGFVYADGGFGGSDPANAEVTGTRLTTDGVSGNTSLQVYNDGFNNSAASNISGNWSRSISVAKDAINVDLTFSYRHWHASQNDGNENSYVYVEVDGVRYGVGANDYVSFIAGNSSTTDTGWVQVTLNIADLGVGSHTLTMGLFQNASNRNDEDSYVRFDDITLSGDESVVTYDAGAGAGTTDTLNGGAGNDNLYGSRGTSILNGDAGDDTLYSSSVLSASIADILAANPEAIHIGQGWIVHTFTTVGTTDWTAHADIDEVWYLLVGGGGGGGGRHGGGGGGGGVLTNWDSGTAHAITGGDTYTITVGDGGTYSQTSPTNQSVGTNGGSSSFDGMTALGGGGGGSYTAVVPSGGGSGGGGGGVGPTTPGTGDGHNQNRAGGIANQGDSADGQGYGNNGGIGAGPGATPDNTGGGGGGGAGAAGGNASGQFGGNGGNGLQSDITGAMMYYAGGGGGGSGGTIANTTTGGLGGGGNGGSRGGAGTAGTDGLGGGGGGARSDGPSGSTGTRGSDGGSGVVVLRYQIDDVFQTTLAGGEGNDDLYGSGGFDIFAFSHVGAAHVDTIYNFDSRYDKIDLSALLSGYDPLSDAITNFVRITDSGADSDLRVDTTGSGSFGASTVVATISGVTGLTDEAALESIGLLMTV